VKRFAGSLDAPKEKESGGEEHLLHQAQVGPVTNYIRRQAIMGIGRSAPCCVLLPQTEKIPLRDGFPQARPKRGEISHGQRALILQAGAVGPVRAADNRPHCVPPSEELASRPSNTQFPLNGRLVQLGVTVGAANKSLQDQTGWNVERMPRKESCESTKVSLLSSRGVAPRPRPPVWYLRSGNEPSDRSRKEINDR
jgi:hypothetical protein